MNCSDNHVIYSDSKKRTHTCAHSVVTSLLSILCLCVAFLLCWLHSDSSVWIALGLVLSSRFFSIPYFFSVVGRNYPELATSQLEIQQESWGLPRFPPAETNSLVSNNYSLLIIWKSHMATYMHCNLSWCSCFPWPNLCFLWYLIKY